MALIKGTSAESMARDAIVLDLGDLRLQAEAILDGARNKAAAIIRDAEENARQLTAQAAEEGHAEGHRAGFEEGVAAGRETGREECRTELSARLDDLINRWTRVIDRWERAKGEVLLQAREDVVVFAMEVAKKLVYRVIELDPAVVRDQVTEALALVGRPSSVIVQVHPDDQDLIEEMLPELQGRFNRCEHLSVKHEPSIERGGCIISTAGGTIDATIANQIERIARTLLPARIGAPTDEDSHSAP